MPMHRYFIVHRLVCTNYLIRIFIASDQLKLIKIIPRELTYSKGPKNPINGWYFLFEKGNLLKERHHTFVYF